MERHYETICIIKADIGEAAVQEIVKKATVSLEDGGAQVCKVDEWGRRRLAYPIEKKNEGFYVLFDYTSTHEVSKGLERSFKLNENVMRYQTVRIEGKAAVEAASDEAAAVEAAPDEAAAVESASDEAAAKAVSAQGSTGSDEAVSDDKGGENE